jgi:hypothetical protein
MSQNLIDEGAVANASAQFYTFAYNRKNDQLPLPTEFHCYFEA